MTPIKHLLVKQLDYKKSNEIRINSKISGRLPSSLHDTPCHATCLSKRNEQETQTSATRWFAFPRPASQIIEVLGIIATLTYGDEKVQVTDQNQRYFVMEKETTIG